MKRLTGKARDERRERRRRRRELRKDISRLVVIVAIFGVVGLVLRDENVRKHLLDIHEIRHSISPTGSFIERLGSVALFIVCSAPLITIGLPRIWVSALAGALFGAVMGVPVALCASLIGATGTYVLGQSMFASTVKRRFGRRLWLWRERFQANAFRWTLYARLFPFTNATLTSLLCGSCKVGLGPFLLASSIGFLPLTISFAVLGSAATKSNSLQLALGAVVLLLSMMAQRLYRPQKANTPGDSRDGEAQLD